jgi:Fe2+ or Zn2+ uptake regulation protein
MLAISSKLQRMSTQTNREVITAFLLNHPKAYTGFTTVELYAWLNKTIGLQPISKTLYKMKLYGVVESVSSEENGRSKVWKLLPKK